MAKLIKCPSCGEGVELPAELSGQVVRCLSCGTTIKIKLRRGGPGLGGGAAPDATSAAGGDAGDSLEGLEAAASAAASAIAPPPPPPSAPAEAGQCAVCGGSYGPDQLTSERGRAICRTCYAKIRGKAPPPRDEEQGQADEVAEGQDERGKLITMGPAFWTGATAALILLCSQLYLWFTPRPQGRVVLTPPPVELRVPRAPDQAQWEAQKRQEIQDLVRRADALRASSDSEQRKQAVGLYEQVSELVADRTIRDPELASWVMQAKARAEAMRSVSDPLGAGTGVLPDPISPIARPEPRPTTRRSPEPPPPVETEAPAAQAPAPEQAAPAGLDEGMRALQDASASEADAAAQHYLRAAREFRSVVDGAGRQPSAAQVQALDGLAAANIGVRRFDVAAAPINRALLAVRTPTRSMIINRSIVDLALDRTERLGEDLDALGGLLASSDTPDERALNVFGTMLAEIEKRPGMDAASLAPYWRVYDEAEARLERRRPGERRWGVQWLAASEFDAVQKAAQRLEPARQELEAARERYERVAVRARGTTAASTAEQAYRQKLAELRQIEESYRPRRWLTRYEPALPDPVDEAAMR